MLHVMGITNKPDFFIVGAPKCGTTSLAEYLNSNPRVFVTNPKEPFYFCKDFNNIPLNDFVTRVE